MTLEERVGRLFLIGIIGTQLTEETKQVLDKIKPGFIILFQRNIHTKDQLMKLISDIKNHVKRDIVFAIDQEGGIVTRLEKGFSISPGAMALSASKNPQNARQTGRLLGKEMKTLGISWNLAPVVDINDNYLNRSTGVRSFGDEAQQVCEYSEAFYKGLQEAGCAATAKHFPGSGSIEVDPHLDLPTLDKSLDELMKKELIPFKSLIKTGIESIMISHVYLPQIMKERLPSVISPEVMKELLIEKLGFKGILISDDLTMGAVTNFHGVEQASLHALLAGMDVIDICHDSSKMIKAHEYLVKLAAEDEEVNLAVKRSFQKVDSFIKRFNVPLCEMDTTRVGTHENLTKMSEISDQAITIFKNETEMIPLNTLNDVDLICSVTPLRQSLVEDERTDTLVSEFLRDRFQKADFLSFSAKINEEDVEKLLKDKSGKKAIILTENAYLFSGQKKMVTDIVEKYDEVLLIALRNPYDGGIKGIKNAIFSYGYTLPNQNSLIRVLNGEIKAQGCCPVKIPDIE